MTEEMSFQVSLENCQEFSVPDEGGKFIPPARNGEWKRSGEWFCASLWWHHESTLARRSQTSSEVTISLHITVYQTSNMIWFAVTLHSTSLSMGRDKLLDLSHLVRTRSNSPGNLRIKTLTRESRCLSGIFFFWPTWDGFVPIHFLRSLFKLQLSNATKFLYFLHAKTHVCVIFISNVKLTNDNGWSGGCWWSGGHDFSDKTLFRAATEQVALWNRETFGIVLACKQPSY